MPVAAQCGMPFTQVLALRESCPSRQEVPAGTAACGWGQCFCTVAKRWTGSGFILSVSLTLRKKPQKNKKKPPQKSVFLLLLRIPVYKKVGIQHPAMDAYLFKGPAEA